MKIEKVMYCLTQGVVTTDIVRDEILTTTIANGGILGYKLDGRHNAYDRFPSLITLEEAVERGYVKKIIKQKVPARIKYRSLTGGKLYITSDSYVNVVDFDNNCCPGTKFVSFVDDNLNECDPPEFKVEYEELREDLYAKSHQNGCSKNGNS